MKVAIVHDDLMQWGGAERVLLGLCEIYPQAPIFTSVFDEDNESLSRSFGSKKVITSFLQKIPGWKSLYKALLPFYPIAFEQFDFTGYDLMISNTTRFAKSIITKPKTLHICYCHTPPRFLWHFSGEGNFGLGEILMTKLRIYDQVAAHRVDYFLAGSENAQKRIKRVYGKDSKVVYPFIDIDRFKDIETFDGGYFVIITRLNRYKRVDLAVLACLELGLPLKVIGTGPEWERLRKIGGDWGNVEFLGNVDDEIVISVLAGCKALIIPGVEDFGLTPLEAQALGKPVIAFKAGGVVETIEDGKTGILYNVQAVESLKEAIRKLDHQRKNKAACQRSAARFSIENFIKNFKQAIASLLYT